MAILIVVSGQIVPCNSSELSSIKRLTPIQEAVSYEQEELYDKLISTPPDQYPNLIARLQNLLKKQEVAFGPDSPQVACTLDQLWDIYKLQKDPEPQIAVARRSMEIKRKILGPQAIDATMALCHLANSLAANKQYEAALSKSTDRAACQQTPDTALSSTVEKLRSGRRIRAPFRCITNDD